MSDVKKMIEAVIKFRDERDWKQFHDPKDCAISLMLEAAELLEHFQWKSKEEIQKHVQEHKEDIGDELADVLYFILIMSYDLNINIVEALHKKIEKNSKKYPIEKSKGNHTKYTQL